MKNTKLEDIDFYSISEDDARALGPFGSGDGPATVTCYGDTLEWRSRKAALAFYKAGAMSCDGSEADRYWHVARSLAEGGTVVDDAC